MRKVLATVMLFAVLEGCTASTANRQTPDEEQALAARLEGRTAGAAESCVSTLTLRGNRGFGETAILFETTSSGLVYLNRPPHGCPRLTADTALRIRSTSTQLCRGDLVTVFDPTAGIDHGGCALGDFIPYRR